MTNLPPKKTTLAVLMFFTTFTQVMAGDPVAGKLKAEQHCAQCHRPSDFNGETTPGLESLIAELNAGKIPHRKKVIQLSNQDIADIAAYWTRPQKR